MSSLASKESSSGSSIMDILITISETCFNSWLGIIMSILLILFIQTKTGGYLTVENHLLYRLRMILPNSEQTLQKSNLSIKITTMNEEIIKTLYFYNDLDYLFFAFMTMVFSIFNVHNVAVILVFIVLLFRIYTNMYQKRRNAMYYLTFIISLFAYLTKW